MRLKARIGGLEKRVEAGFVTVFVRKFTKDQ